MQDFITSVLQLLFRKLRTMALFHANLTVPHQRDLAAAGTVLEHPFGYAAPITSV